MNQIITLSYLFVSCSQFRWTQFDRANMVQYIGVGLRWACSHQALNTDGIIITEISLNSPSCLTSCPFKTHLQNHNSWVWREKAKIKKKLTILAVAQHSALPAIAFHYSSWRPWSFSDAGGDFTLDIISALFRLVSWIRLFPMVRYTHLHSLRRNISRYPHLQVGRDYLFPRNLTYLHRRLQASSRSRCHILYRRYMMKVNL